MGRVCEVLKVLRERRINFKGKRISSSLSSCLFLSTQKSRDVRCRKTSWESVGPASC